MKILICTNSLGAKGGLEKITIIKANALAEIEGNEVAVCFTDKGTYPEDTIHPVSPRVRVYDLGVSFWDLSLSIRNLMVAAPRKFMALRKALRHVIADFSPDVVVTTGSYEKFGVASLNPSKITGHPAVKVREFHFNSNYRRYIDTMRFPAVAEWIDCSLLPRFFDKSFLLTKEDRDTNFPDNPKYDFVYNPLTFGKLDVIPPMLSRPRKMMTAARFEDQKNLPSMLRVWAMVAARRKGWTLDIVGRGSQLDMLREMAGKLGITDNINFLEFRKDIRNMLVDSRIYLFTSKYEGFGLTLVEAMAAGTVPVSFRTPYGPADIIVDGESGVLIDYGDEKQMADRIVDLIDDEERQTRMSAAAVERSSYFSLDRIIGIWMEKYRGLLAGRY